MTMSEIMNEPVRESGVFVVPPLGGPDRLKAELRTDETVHSPHTRLRGVQALNIESRPWIEGFPVCRILNHYQMVHLGIEETKTPTRIVRTRQTTTYFLACLSGQGRVLVNGSWQ